MKKSHVTGNWFFYLLFCTSLVLTWFFHKDATRFSDRTELWSDRAGYYIYLPATFIFHFDTRQMPADLDSRTGGGFGIDTLHHKLDTKYTYGVALMESPFFLIAGLVSHITGYDDEKGFSMLYMRMMCLAAVVWLILGIWFLKKFLDFYFRPAVGFFVITMIFLGTNLFYYSLIDGMMSHVYSFFLFAFYLYVLKKFQATRRYRYFIILCLSLALAVLIRPTNILLGSIFFFWDTDAPAEWLKRIKQFMKPSFFLCFLAILFILFLPQMIYWKYLSGSWLHFSYRDEGFTNWRNPEITAVLFSPLNGLFTYTPLVFIFITGIFMMIFRKTQNGWLIATLFVLVTIICASWKMWYFGCSFGQRSFIEYYTILAVPFGYFTTKVYNMSRFPAKAILLFMVFLFVYFNLRVTISGYRFERCYYGSTWDWDHYLRSIERTGFISPVRQIQSFSNDFENLAILPGGHSPSKIFTRSGLYSISTTGKKEIIPLFSIYMDDFMYPWPKTMEVATWVLKPGIRPTGAGLAYTLTRGHEVIFSDEQKIDSIMKIPMNWSEVNKTFIIPDVYDSSLQVNIFIQNPKHTLMFVDDLKVRFHYRVEPLIQRKSRK